MFRDQVEVRMVAEQFQRSRALAGDHVGVVVGRNLDVTVALDQRSN